MIETRTPEQIAMALGLMKRAAESLGWTQVDGWIFKAPSGTVHDLSACDPTKLQYIEHNKLCLHRPAKYALETAIESGVNAQAVLTQAVRDLAADGRIHCPESYGFEGPDTFSGCGECIICLAKEYHGEST